MALMHDPDCQLDVAPGEGTPAVIVVVEASELPGRTCRPEPDAAAHTNVHVGLCVKASKRLGVEPVPGRPWGVVGVVRGDAPSARWEATVEVRERDGALDFAGPYVRGNRG